MKSVPSFTTFSDNDLLNQARHLAGQERMATTALIACLAEVDARRLYLDEGCSSLFAWCTEILHLSGDAAYGRIEAARVARRFPAVLDALANGSLTMTVVALLRPHLTEVNHRDLLAQAHHKSKRQVEQLVAALAPKPDVPASIRKLPAPATRNRAIAVPSANDPSLGTPDRAEPAVSLSIPTPKTTILRGAVPAQRPVIAPLAPERFKVQFTVSQTALDRLRRAQDLLRHAIPNGDLEEIFDRALTMLVRELEKQKTASVSHPRPAGIQPVKGRTIPAAVRRAVSLRDGNRCAFVGRQGRCTATAFLEFHHIVRFADGGPATEENIQLRCRAHNQYEAEQALGPRDGLFVRESRVAYAM